MLDFGLPKIGILGMNCCPMDAMLKLAAMSNVHIQGHYQITDDHIEYQDDTGFTADGDFINGILYHAGMVLHRERS